MCHTTAIWCECFKDFGKLPMMLLLLGMHLLLRNLRLMLIRVARCSRRLRSSALALIGNIHIVRHCVRALIMCNTTAIWCERFKDFGNLLMMLLPLAMHLLRKLRLMLIRSTGLRIVPRLPSCQLFLL